jgi:hypothetical protein
MLSAIVDAYLARIQLLQDAGKHEEARDLAHELAESLRLLSELVDSDHSEPPPTTRREALS